MIEYKKQMEDLEMNKNTSSKIIKIALLNTYTINNVANLLEGKLRSEGFNPEIKIGGYKQFIQELSNENSWLRDFKPDIIFIALSSTSYLELIEYSLQDKEPDVLREMIHEKVELIERAIGSYELPAKIIISCLDKQSYSPFGILDLVKDNGMNALVNKFNDDLIKIAKRNDKVALLDFDKVLSDVGKSNITDEKFYYLGKILLNEKASNALASELSLIINAIYGNNKKCIVLDLDNTLWGGIIGEDGPNGIEIGITNIGEIYLDIQRILLNYKKSGVLLAIVSKNNPEDVEEAFKKNKNILLSDKDFVAKRVNWKRKSENIDEISKELNIGLDSFVFLDDNPVERLEVKTALPQVSIIDFPKDIALLPKTLKSLPFFHKIVLTEEDKNRNEMYMQERERNSLKSKLSLNEYLTGLEIKIIVDKNDLSSLERITQLINKTNQFNLRTQRYSSDQVKSMMQNGGKVFSLSAFDKFGSLGLTGVAILTKEDKGYFIDSFLLSCRILSRDIEKQFFNEIVKDISSESDHISSEYIQTPKNGMCKEFYKNLGFKLIESNQNCDRYIMFLNENPNIKDIGWINVEKNAK